MKKKHLHDDNFAVVAGDMAELEARYAESRERWEHVTRTLELTPAPLHVDIELTNICDIQCAMCERRLMKRPLGNMSMDLFQQIVDECARIGVESLKLNLWGESVLHKRLPEMIRYAKANSQLILQFNTNANRMTPDISRELVRSGLDKLTISLDGVTRETYEKVRCGSNFERVIQNVNALLEAKTAAAAALPLVTLQIIRMDITTHEVDAFVENWKDRVDYVSVTNIGATTADSQVLSHSLREVKRKTLRPCRQLWQRLSIFWDGTVTVCCNDFDGFLAVGKVGDTPLVELWQGEKLNGLRAKHRKLQFENLICESCSDIVTYGD